MTDVAPESSAAASKHANKPSLAPVTGEAEAIEVTPSIENGVIAEVPQSQPMTATTSSASQNLTQADGDGSAEAATYGTRSRNKGGNARPNYADDRELDLEIEASGRIQKSKPKKAGASSTSLAGTQVELVPVQNGFSAVNTATITTNGVSPTIPGMSTFSTQAPATLVAPSKKRKQPGANNTTAPTTSAQAPVSAPSKSRGAHSSSPNRIHLETNMMSFSRCHARLNAKMQLVAEDGTVLVANGEAPAISLIDCC